MTKSHPPRYGNVESFLSNLVDEEIVETVCSVLGNERRQLVVLFLLDCGPEEWVAVEEVARWIGGIEEGAPAEAITGQTYKRTRTSLTQSHLSVLAEADVINYNSHRQKVAKGSCFESIGRYLLILLLTLQAP